MTLAAESFFSLDRFGHRDLFAGTDRVWQALDGLKSYIADHIAASLKHEVLHSGIPLTTPLVLHHGRFNCAREYEISFGDATRGELVVMQNGQRLEGASVLMAGAVLLGRMISIGHGVLVESGAMIKEPTIIGDQSEIRQGAYLRGHCLVGERCVVGHATEVKHSILLDEAKAGHFAYLGDSILGNDVNLGAGTKLANLRFLDGTIRVRNGRSSEDTGRRKLGAILGDRVQTGCNSVTSPGTLIGPDSLLMPNQTAPSGFHPAGSRIR